MEHLDGCGRTGDGARQKLWSADGLLISGLVPEILRNVRCAVSSGPRHRAQVELCDFHKQGLTEFAEELKVLILRAAYYLGESFHRRASALSWTIGNAELIEKNIPVISGFRSGTEMCR